MHAVEVSQPTVCRVRKQYFEEGLEAAINRRPPNPEYHRKLDGEQEARLVALACSEPPEGQALSSAAGLRGVRIAPTAFGWAHASWDNAGPGVPRRGWGERQTGSGDSALGARDPRGGGGRVGVLDSHSSYPRHGVDLLNLS
jgi:hypothetical protein